MLIFVNFVIKSIFIRFIFIYCICLLTSTFNAVHHQTQLFSAAVYSSPRFLSISKKFLCNLLSG